MLRCQEKGRAVGSLGTRGAGPADSLSEEKLLSEAPVMGRLRRGGSRSCQLNAKGSAEDFWGMQGPEGMGTEAGKKEAEMQVAWRPPQTLPRQVWEDNQGDLGRNPRFLSPDFRADLAPEHQAHFPRVRRPDIYQQGSARTLSSQFQPRAVPLHPQSVTRSWCQVPEGHHRRGLSLG